jgi:hypothetical protein
MQIKGILRAGRVLQTRPQRFCYPALTAFSLEVVLNVRDWVANPVPLRALNSYSTEVLRFYAWLFK